MKIQIAVLLTCHNRYEKTLTCLESLYKCILPEKYALDTFLVDDGSTDGTKKFVEKNFPMVKIIMGSGNLYWNRGMNLAWSQASSANDYDYYLWLNDDTFLFKNSLMVMFSTINSYQNTAIIIAACCSKQTGKLTYSGYLRNGEMIQPEDKPKEAATFSGNCILIPKFAFDKIGYLDPLFHHAIGDVDYGYRAKSKGIKSFVAPGFLAYCEDHVTRADWCLKEIPLKKRIRSLYSPLGNSHPYYFFRYEFRHFGLQVAIKHFITIHLRLFLPQLWK